MPQLLNVLPPRQAWLKLEPHLSAIGRVEAVATAEAMGRVVAEDIVAPGDLPFFPRSTMDGYAVRAEDTYGASEGLPAYLRVVGEVRMGSPADIVVGPGEAVLIHTGGMLPGNADAVVMVENTREVDSSTIEVVRPAARGENVLQVGEEVRKGDLLLPAGSIVRAQEIGGLLSQGITEITVLQRVKVGLISTGDELVPPEEVPQPGQVRNTNAYTLAALAFKAGAIPLRLGIMRDDREALVQAARDGLRQADIVVISAGSSASARDMTADVIRSLGEPGVLVHGVALRPGKPTILGVVNGKPIFGLPGNPSSAMVTFELFVTPCIYRLSGCRQPLRRFVKARLTRNIASAAGREDYVPVKLHEQDGEMLAEPVFGKSNLLSNMMRADGMAQVPLDRNGLAEGESALVIPF
ncbi:MAG: molybdopterin molybdenumtransferase MoeA [Chloroflexi bacterium]|nr:MAG: molybdopterin molybdenumtransferase MoeA [Chloroflexota bacterium]